LFSPDLIDAAGDAVDGFLVSCQFVSGPAYYQFLMKYKEVFGTDSPTACHAHAYDAAMLVFAAIEKTAIQEPDGALHIPRQMLREAMVSTRGFPGVTGKLSCNPNGDCADPLIAVYEYHAGLFPPVKIWP